MRPHLVALMVMIVLPGCNPVVNFFAFHPNTTYILPVDALPPETEEVFFVADDDVRLQALYLKKSSSRKLAIFFHGNAGNIYHRLGDYQDLRRLGTNVLALSYRGYAKSSGSPSEGGLYQDGQAAYDYATKSLGFAAPDILIVGRSIGSTVATDLAQNKQIAGLILISPLSSGKDQASVMGLAFASALAGDAFQNVEKIKQLKAPLLVIHGSNDRIIPLAMGRKVFTAAPEPKSFHEIAGAGHNDLTNRYADMYWGHIKNFINKTVIAN